MIKVENLSMLFSTEEVEYTWNIRYPYFGLLSL